AVRLFLTVNVTLTWRFDSPTRIQQENPPPPPPPPTREQPCCTNHATAPTRTRSLEHRCRSNLIERVPLCSQVDHSSLVAVGSGCGEILAAVCVGDGKTDETK
ncbi:unnamed protein product, partial [Pylaiella littoralis]